MFGCGMRVLALSVVSLALAASTVAADEEQGIVHITIVGATGSLAKKYLWRAALDLNKDKPAGITYKFWGGARAEASKGAALVTEYINAVKCDDTIPEEECAKHRQELQQHVAYVQLKTQDDYQNFAETLNASTAELSQPEVGRIFYLSVPPFTYANLSAIINGTLRGPGYVRTVLEKPFGRDYADAVESTLQITPHLSEEELFRIDHYVGKPAFQMMRAFVQRNQQFLHKHFKAPSYGVISLMETEDVSGRTEYYDQYGVIRDVIQNHLTEIYAALLLDISGEEMTQESKAALFERTTVEDLLVGQYDGYKDHVAEQLDDDSKYLADNSTTPTFAAIELYEAAHFGRPFVLTAGKKMSERVMNVSLHFRDSEGHMLGDLTIHFQGRGDLPHVHFQNTPFFNKLTFDDAWHFMDDLRDNTRRAYETIMSNEPAYSFLLRQVVQGHREYFISSAELEASWLMWTECAGRAHTTPLRSYTDGGHELGWTIFENEVVYNDHVPFHGHDEL